MRQDVLAALSVANKIRDEYFPSAKACLLAGSVVRGDATEFSDLDLVVVFESIENARRQSFSFANWPVEAFIHDPQTLEYFFRQVDRPSGVPCLPNMVNEGIEVPGETECGRFLKDLAHRILEEGPIPWHQEDRENSRYAITDMVQDIRAPRSPDELRLVVSNLYTALANHFCRSQNQWSAKGKSIPGRLMDLDPVFQKHFAEAFEAAFTNKDVTAVIQLCEHVLEPDGGFLFEGFTRDAPSNWRVPDP